MPRPGKVKTDTPKIDRNKYKQQLEKGEYAYTGTPGAFGADILKKNNFNVVGGSEQGGDLVAQSGDDYFLYSQQPGYAAGLVNIGKINPFQQTNTTSVIPPVTTTTAVQPTQKPKPVIDPSRKDFVFGQNYYTDPNTGKNYSYDDHKEIPTMTQELKKGGVVKKYATGGSPYFDEKTGTYTGTPQNTVTTDKGADLTGIGGGVAAGLTGVAGQLLLNNVGNDPNKFQKTKNNDALLSSVGGTAANAIIPGSGALVAPALALKSQWQNQAEEIDPETGAFKNKAKAGQYGLVNGLLNASPLGALGTVLDKDKSLKEKALAVGTGGISNAFTWKGDMDETESKNIALADKLKAEKLQKENERVMNSSVGNAFAERGFADGGEIKGKGTGTSDSVKAKIRPGSFIVPAKNADKAKEIKAAMGKNPNDKAEVKQPGGVPGLKVSNGEVLFTPEEVQELTAAGIDLNKLAPEAKQKLRTDHVFKCGGNVKMYAKGGPVEEEKKKIAEQRKKELAAKAVAELVAKKDRQKNNQRADIYEGLETQTAAKKKAAAELKKQEAELKALRKSYDDYSKESDFEVNRPTTSGENFVGTSAKPKTESVRQEKEKLLNMIQAKEAEFNKAKQAVEFANNEKNFISGAKKELPIGDSEFAQNVREAASKSQPEQKYIVDPASPEIPTAAEVAAAKQTPAVTAPKAGGIASKVSNIDPLRPTPITVDDTAGMYPPAATTAPSTSTGGFPAVQTEQQAPAMDTGANTKATGLLSKLNVDQIANYALPALQTGLGMKMLNDSGARPVDDYDPDFLKSIDDARNAVTKASKNAEFGFSPEEKFLMNQENQALTNSQRFAARNNSGGSASNAIVNDTAAINSSYGRGLASRIADNQLRLQKESLVDAKQQALDNKLTEKAGVSRMLFGDTMNAWNQNQQAASSLLGSGLSNAIGAQRLNTELNYRKERDEKYNPQYII